MNWNGGTLGSKPRKGDEADIVRFVLFRRPAAGPTPGLSPTQKIIKKIRKTVIMLMQRRMNCLFILLHNRRKGANREG